MDVRFEDPSLEKLEVDPKYTAGLDAALVKAFRKRLQFIRAALDERAFYAMKSLHYEKLVDFHAKLTQGFQSKLTHPRFG